jgi:hypothetical protein
MPRLVRKFLAALLTLAVLLGPASIAGASPMAHGGMAMAGQMPCGEHKPMPARDMPCGHECCLCVLGCTALANGPVAIIPAAFSIPQAAWPHQHHPDGLSLKPALPPPIVRVT